MAEDNGGEGGRGAISVSMGRSPTIEIKAQHPRFVRARRGRIPRKQVKRDGACVGEDDARKEGTVLREGWRQTAVGKDKVLRPKQLVGRKYSRAAR